MHRIIPFGLSFVFSFGLVSCVHVLDSQRPARGAAQSAPEEGWTEGRIDARMMRHPDVSATRIAFVYAGDIWVVPKSGGAAMRLSSPKGEESFPRFSPDGELIAFSANYDGNADLYVMPAGGGLPRRVTHHPAPDRLVDWHPDGGSLLYATIMTSGRTRFNQLYTIPPEGGLPERLPIPYGEFASISPDGSSLAYVPLSRDFRTWKRYRGGMAPDIWLFNLRDHSARNITNDSANDGLPMWHGDTLYFLSDRGSEKRANLWAFETESDEFRQVTRFEDHDVHFPSIGPEEIVFENAGRLHLLNLDDESVSEVEISVVTDRATLKPRAEKVSDLIFSASVSPSGKRAVFGARGEIFSVPAEHGVIRNLTRSSGVAERYPSWSPDGKQIAYFSDRSGEYELTIRAADGSGEEKKLTTMGPGYRYRLHWSPDGKKLVFIDSTMTLRIYDLEDDKLRKIDQGLWRYQGALHAFKVSWSADSRWLAFSRGLDNRNEALFIYDTIEGELHQVTSGFFDDYSPEFDPEGKYLYFLSERDLRPSYGDYDNTWIYTNSTRIYAATLRDDVASPLAPRNDEEPAEENAEEEDDKDDEPKDDEESESDEDEEEDQAKGKKKPEPLEIDIESLESRAVALPPEAGRYGRIKALKGKVLYLKRPRNGSADTKSSVVFYDLKEREEKTVLEDISGFHVTVDEKKMLAWKDSDFFIVDVKPDQKMEKKLRTGEMEMTLDPAAEWKQLFTEAWRLERDLFYDPGLHGIDWEDLRERYGDLLQDAVTRWDVNFIIGELIGELNASHTYRSGGDSESAERRGVGLLGADFSLENGAYRIAKIVRGAPWETEVRSPLAEPGVEVDEGDYLLAVNGVQVDVTLDPWAAFDGLAGKTVELTVNGEPTIEGARRVLVKTLSSEVPLRYRAWVEANRKKVEEATDGRVGYVYVPDTGIGGQTDLFRQYRPQFTKEGLIIDERFNSGGQIPDRFIELMNRPLYNYWAVRDGKDWQWPQVSHRGPKVMLINGWSGSGGDAFPAYFRQAGLGPLIGTRTWGGLIGMTGAPGLIDGGRVTVPTFGIYSTDGEWTIEGYGVDPDIEVIDDPSLMVEGGDPQLERAIEEVLAELKRNPVRPVKKPRYPSR